MELVVASRKELGFLVMKRIENYIVVLSLVFYSLISISCITTELEYESNLKLINISETKRVSVYQRRSSNWLSEEALIKKFKNFQLDTEKGKVLWRYLSSKRRLKLPSDAANKRITYDNFVVVLETQNNKKGALMIMGSYTDGLHRYLLVKGTERDVWMTVMTEELAKEFDFLN